MTQLALQQGWQGRNKRIDEERGQGVSGDIHQQQALCEWCRQREARYGFRPNDAEPGADRPRTLCFACFRAELDRRQAIAAQLARGWNATQVRLPLDETLQALTRRRRRAQIAARHALDLST